MNNTDVKHSYKDVKHSYKDVKHIALKIKNRIYAGAQAWNR